MKQAKSNKFDIIVGIPSYNEADSITNTAKKIDKGLIKYFPTYRSLIVNVDSRSTDGTSQIFLSTKTKTAKISVVSSKRLRGKGVNVFLLLKLSKKFGAKYIATIDADITTITEKWPKLLLTPIIRGKADFVAPAYTRNRYEGNTTNHFCFPLLYAWFGQQLNQPIGGDFAMNSRFTDYVLDQRKQKNSFLYGIDIFLSTHAVGANFKIEETYLGRKIHKPSFDKIVPMFQQVAATMLYVLPQYKRHQKLSHRKITLKNIKRIDDFIRKPNRSKIIFLEEYAFRSLGQLPVKEIRKYLEVNPEEVKFISKTKSLIQEDNWVKILGSLINYLSQNPISYKTASKIATLVSPFFFLRVLAYFEELEMHKGQKSVDVLINRQAKKVKKLISSD